MSDFNLTAPQHITSLATSAILVRVEMRTTTLSSTDETVSAEITNAKKADRDSGSFVNKLVGNNAHHRAVMAHRASIKNWLDSRCYEWGGSYYLLPVDLIPKFMKEYDEREGAFYTDVDAFMQEYPTIVGSMAFKRGDLFNRDDYPTVDQLRAKFSMRLYRQEVPTGDFRVTVADDLAADLKNHYEIQTNDMIKEIGETQSKALRDYMTRLSHSCTVSMSEDKDGQPKVKRNRLHESTIEQALELCDTISKFNPTQDPQLEQARASLAALLQGINIDVLKASDAMRSQTKTEIDDILSKFG